MVHGARAADAAARWRRVVMVEPAPLLASRLPAVGAARLELERLLQKVAAALGIGRERPHAVEPLQRQLGGHLRVLGDQRFVAGLDDGELVPKPFGIDERQPPLLARKHVVVEPLLPEIERLIRSDPPADGMHHPGARAALARARVFEEGDVGARVALLVGVEEVVDGRVVLVDRLLHHAQAQHSRVEVDVSRRVPSDRRDVVDSFELHGRSSGS